MESLDKSFFSSAFVVVVVEVEEEAEEEVEGSTCGGDVLELDCEGDRQGEWDEEKYHNILMISYKHIFNVYIT